MQSFSLFELFLRLNFFLLKAHSVLPVPVLVVPLGIEASSIHQLGSGADCDVQWPFFEFGQVREVLPVFATKLLPVVEVDDGFDQHCRIGLADHVAPFVFYLSIL